MAAPRFCGLLLRVIYNCKHITGFAAPANSKLSFGWFFKRLGLLGRLATCRTDIEGASLAALLRVAPLPTENCMIVPNGIRRNAYRVLHLSISARVNGRVVLNRRGPLALETMEIQALGAPRRASSTSVGE